MLRNVISVIDTMRRNRAASGTRAPLVRSVPRPSVARAPADRGRSEARCRPTAWRAERQRLSAVGGDDNGKFTRCA